MTLDRRILDLDARAVFLPVRHHSPACARMVRELARELRPAAILIEGPSDFNDRIGELSLPHRLPVAVYTFLRQDGLRRGAYYPFCVYSPEWQALEAASELGIPARFIDLPWPEMAFEETPEHRYADGELRFSDYVQALCARLGVESFDTLWDTLFEIDPLTPRECLERCHLFCFQARQMDSRVPTLDLRREAFMADQILATLAQIPGRLLVVTGGFHSYALWERVQGSGTQRVPGVQEGPDYETNSPSPPAPEVAADYQTNSTPGWSGGQTPDYETNSSTDRSPGEARNYETNSPETPPPNAEPRTTADLRPFEDEHEDEDDSQHPHTHPPAPRVPATHPHTGIALTPYSYARLDSLTGYESGVPNPGFYHQVWEDRLAGRRHSYRFLLARVVKELRARGQQFSTADLIAVESTAQGLATLRGHEEVWRADLVDGIIGALIKDELELGLRHPFLDAVHEVFRGQERGRLAEGTELPPLVHDIRRLLAEHDLEPEPREKRIELELTREEDLARSRVLYRLRLLGIQGYERTAGTDLVTREDLARFWEEWRVRWSPDLEAGCIEAALYGPTLEEAAAARLLEGAGKIERDAEKAALLLLEAALAGLAGLKGDLLARLIERIREDGSFFTVTGALDHVLYLYRYDHALGTAGVEEIGGMLVEAFERGVWLLESLGRPQGTDRELLRGVGALVETYHRCSGSLDLAREELVGALGRAGTDDRQSPLMRGAATGALWTLGEAGTEEVLAGLRYCSDPDRLGDFLTGLFSLARETVQRHPELVLSIDDLLLAYGDEPFLEALPALRLAFSYFTPREKHHMAQTLLEARGLHEAAPLPDLEVDLDTAARALALEARVFEAVKRYGLRGGDQ